MCEYFPGWRRKFGVASLVLASAFMACWIRSQITCDLLEFATNNQSTANKLSLDETGIFWWRQQSRNGAKFDSGIYYRTYSAGLLDHTHNPFGVNQPDKKSRMFGVQFMHAHHGDHSMFVIIVPYWCVSIPFSLLAAYLLLYKPRSSNFRPEVLGNLPQDSRGCGDSNQFLVESPNC